MASLNVSSRRAPNASQSFDCSIQYETHPGDISRDTNFYVSSDGKRVVQQALNVAVKKRRILPSDLDDAYSSWVPLSEGAWDGDGVEVGGEAEDSSTSTAGEKRKRYESSDDAMNLWRPLIQRFLDELLRREGLGDNSGTCICCGATLSHNDRRFRCLTCGEFIQCGTNGPANFGAWSPWPASVTCTSWDTVVIGVPDLLPTERTMVVMDTEYIHTVKYRYCGCDKSDRAQNLEQLLRNGWYPATTVDPATCATFAALDLFRLLNVVGNINVHDFVGTLERKTNTSQMKAVPDREKAFGRMARQYAFLNRLKRSGRAHDPAGVHNTQHGECAVMCWACPHDKINLPEGWREVSPEFRFLYMLLLAMDANFRLKNRLRANQHEDRPLGSGWGYQVEEGPYKEHLKGYVAEKDVSTCIAFAALMQKDTRLTTGLRCSGVGGVVCARHELVRPQEMGDLQKGERYANMDYILLSAVLGVTAMYLAISYDIACQWQINLPMRMAAMPEHLLLDLLAVTVMFALPVWHAAAHERECQAQNSLSYLPGVGRTDGEGIERTWSHLNPLGWATKEMNVGARHDAIEDKVDHLNFEKNINQETTLPRKLILAIDERDRQVALFTQVDKTLKKGLRKEWQTQIDEWRKNKAKPNPYRLAEGKDGGPGEAAIRLALAQDEAQEAALGGTKLHGSSITSFLTAGLHLEETQRRIRKELKGRTLLAADQNQKIAEIRISFFSKLAKFRKLQAVYMPGAIQELEEDEDARDSDLPPPKAEDVKLYLPSGLRRANREEGCRKGLPVMEGKLREGQCRDALKLFRSRLHAKRHLIDHRDSGAVVGQRAATRAQTLIGQVGERVDAAAMKYRRARLALIALRGRDACAGFPELTAADVQLDEEREVDARARKKLGSIGSTRSRRGPAQPRREGPALSSKEKYLSWIWTEGGGPGENEKELHDSIRVEWSKAKARKERWEEEVELLREEMRRVLCFLRWWAIWWEERRTARLEGVSIELRAGLEAYAARQASGARRMCNRFKTAWDTSAASAVRLAVAEDALLTESMSTFSEVEAAEGQEAIMAAATDVAEVGAGEAASRGSGGGTASSS
ncbi:CxC2 domain-containing protein [Mycena sanguinolenta]|uniref:CxC2 domain-containing protein n=1 Tax=Mycena sanguinolenta TaxID=230812 RepID=A0A8H6Y2Y6_9AGAR|nr:CxC2 domain-containing protein [Mycena sanguinolenta]